MRTFVSVAAILATLNLPVSAADLAATSSIDAVTVYPATAEITRVVKIKIPAGEHVVTLADLPMNLDPSSIRVEGRAIGALQINGVDSRVVPQQAAAALVPDTEHLAIEEKIEKLEDEKEVVRAEIEALMAQKRLIEKLVERQTMAAPALPVRPGETVTAPASLEPAQMLTLVGERSAALQKVILDNKKQLRDLDRRIAMLRLGFKKPPAPTPAYLDVRVTVTASAETEAELLVRYVMAGATWTPTYDARLTTAADNRPVRLEFIRRAVIQQNTGEAWGNVALSLSTARPTATTAAPELHMLNVDFGTPTPTAGAADGRRSNTYLGLDTTNSTTRFGFDGKAATQQQAAADIATFDARFTVPGRVTLSTGAESKRVQITSEDITPELLVRAVPRLDPNAYLYAKMVVPASSAPILRGEVTLVRDGAYIGKGQIADLAPGEDHELAFGKDDRVKVKRVVLEDKAAEKGLITTSRVEDRDFQITVRNLHASTVKVHLLDRAPVPAHDDIKVAVRFRDLEPTKQNYLDRRGTMLWDLSLAPAKEQVVTFGYRVTAPKDRQIAYRDMPEFLVFQGAKIRF